MNTYPLSDEGITDALTALGNDPDVIAATLHAGGFKGVRDDEGCCVVANYLRAVLPPVDEVYVWQGGCWVQWSWQDENGLDMEKDHFDWHPTPSFAAFIDKFDRRQYPELVEEVETA